MTAFKKKKVSPKSYHSASQKAQRVDETISMLASMKTDQARGAGDAAGRWSFSNIWQGSRMMLPEHRAALFDWLRHQADVEPPELSEDALSELERAFQAALTGRRYVELRWYDRHWRCVETARGELLRVDGVNRTLFWQREGAYTIERLPMDALLGITLLENDER